MKIVLALDRSRHSRAAAQFLERMRWPAGSILTLLHVSHKVARHSPCSVLVVRKNSR
jgi:hypothetical protein